MLNIDLGSPILDIAIGLSFVFFLLAVIASAINEGIASVLNWRGKTLEEGLKGMLNSGGAVESLLEHDLVRTELDKDPRGEASGRRLWFETFLPKAWRRYERSSSYIAPEVFADAFKDLYGDLKDQPGIEAQLQALGVTGAWGGLQGDLKKVERWFDHTMDRVSGWYRRKSQIATVAIAVFVAIGLNASALRIVERLQQEPTVRTALAAQGEAAVKETKTSEEAKEKSLEHAGEAASSAYDKLGAMKVPLLWGGENVPSGVSGWATTVLGWLLTVIAISAHRSGSTRSANSPTSARPGRNPNRIRPADPGGRASLGSPAMKIWVDCTAAAHPLVLRPIIERLEARGDEVFITAREYGQTVGILDRLGMHYTVVGEHGGASKWAKGRAVEKRSRALTKLVWDKRPELALAHGSVDLAVVSWLLRLPSVQMQDYEFAKLQRNIAFRAAHRVLAPDAIPVDRLRKLGAKPKKLVRYPGLKEEYYLADFVPDAAIIDDLGLDRNKVITVVRPPPETSEYHAPNDLYAATVRWLAEGDGEVQAVIIPRTPEQGEAARALGAPNLLIPDRAIDAQSLIACADLVVSAGGTMNREAVALGTPVYTTFSGQMGGVDEVLIHEGRLRVLNDPAELPLRKRSEPIGVLNPRDPEFLVEAVLGAVAVYP